MAQDTLAPWAERVPDAPPMMTAAQLAAMPDDARGYELVDGRLVKMPPAGGWHGSSSGRLTIALGAYVDEHDLGVVLAAETGFLVSQPGAPDTVLAPDVAFVRAERVPTPGSPEYEGFWPLAPDLVIEVASPSQSAPELAAKARRWLDAGVRLVWIVWPKARRVDVWLPGGDAP
ncbi:MAG TPA: Uma2 family endonuclease, partial [Ktedonobacterales bacterium]